MLSSLKNLLARQRAAVTGLTFDQAPELFKDIESTKACMRMAGQKIPPAVAR
ncbi:hypothetical protein [Luteibacter yeojuensis]|uniref:Uncharacterized protein n=1 Tax=Luteibacter yeojuensis TaxID=345309 RepID=A0A7X5QS57_9GAMM|nr:hypothetical protein [Luteibacter yeojuensis]NID14370.1 hypothetical protein [Luteibacter yeojuensis]